MNTILVVVILTLSPLGHGKTEIKGKVMHHMYSSTKACEAKAKEVAKVTDGDPVMAFCIPFSTGVEA